MSHSRWIHAVRCAPLWLVFLCVSACGQSTTSVSLHGVNYSGDAFRYYVMDPKKPEATSGGEMVGPFGAGGTMCCATLPRNWRPGIKLKVRTVRSVKRQSDGQLEEIQEEHSVEVPRYVDGKPGELWVVRTKDGSIEAISSDYQPDHPKWPGTVKGWPVPSLEYRKERWAILMNYEEQGIRLYETLLHELRTDPAKRTGDAWTHALKHEPDVLKNFTGPDDPKFRDYLQQQYDEGLKRTQRYVRELLEVRP